MVAKELDVHVSEVTGLKPLDFVGGDDVTGKVKKGNIKTVKRDNAPCFTASKLALFVKNAIIQAYRGGKGFLCY